MKKHFSSLLLILIFLIGFSVLLYPTVSNLINQRNSTKLIENYDNVVKNISKKDYGNILKAAHKYNDKLAKSISLPKIGGLDGYEDLLNIDGNGIMGYIAFADLNIKLPIYHGTNEALLQSGVGHMSQTSLPVGGDSTHAVITGHRGLPSAKLFTDLDRVAIGNVFYLYIMDEILAYKVDQIRTVEPDDTKDLVIVKGKDYVTCVTCTPYGINTHRLLIRGTRVSYESTIAEKVRSRGNAVILDPYYVAVVLSAPILLTLLTILIIRSQRTKKQKQATEESKSE
jgi:sortase A